MKSAKDIERLAKNIRIKRNAVSRDRILAGVQAALHESEKELTYSKQNIWRIIMRNRITKLAAAACIILAVWIGMKIFMDATKGPTGKFEIQQFADKLPAELSQVRRMAAVGDVKGLSEMLSNGQFESKLVAANFLTKMGKIPAIETTSMHTGGDLILDITSGNIRLRSTSGTDWLEVINGTFHVLSDQEIYLVGRVRLTHDTNGNSNNWERRQRDFANIRREQADLEQELSEFNQNPPENVDELRQRLAKYNETLDFIDDAVYVSIENGRLKLDCIKYHRTATADIRNGNVQVEWHGHIAEADSVTLLYNLAPIRTNGPPEPTPGWRERFDAVYSLDEGEVLRWVRTPFIPERQIYATQELHYYSSTDNPPPPGYLSFFYNGELYNWALAISELSLASVLDDIGLEYYEYRDETPKKLFSQQFSGDWIIRRDAPTENKLRALEKILNDELGRTIKFEKRKVNSDVIIVRGQYKHMPLKGAEDPNKIYVPFNGGGTGNLDKIIKQVGGNFNRPIIFETENPSDIIVSYSSGQYSYSPSDLKTKTTEEIQQILDSALQYLSKQTSLQFEQSRRDVDVWFITEQNKTE